MTEAKPVEAGSGGGDASSRVLRCVECGNFYSARTTDNGELVPYLGTPGNRCPECNGDNFEQVVLAPERA
jgi:DNA-directed RNA polymerase subunit RPC12/RpoP